MHLPQAHNEMTCSGAHNSKLTFFLPFRAANRATKKVTTTYNVTSLSGHDSTRQIKTRCRVLNEQNNLALDGLSLALQ